MRYLNTLTFPQNGGNCVVEELKFQNFPGENPIELPLLKAWIHARTRRGCGKGAVNEDRAKKTVHVCRLQG